MIIGLWLNAFYAFICDPVDMPPWKQSERNPMSFDIIGPDCTNSLPPHLHAYVIEERISYYNERKEKPLFGHHA